MLRNMAPYPFSKQMQIVIAAMAIYNFIVEQKLDSVFEDYERTTNNANETNANQNNVDAMVNELEMGLMRDTVRDQIVAVRNRH